MGFRHSEVIGRVVSEGKELTAYLQAQTLLGAISQHLVRSESYLGLSVNCQRSETQVVAEKAGGCKTALPQWHQPGDETLCAFRGPIFTAKIKESERSFLHRLDKVIRL